MAKNWYVVHVYSGFEQKARLALEERIKKSPLRDMFEEVLVPSENVVEMKKGVKKTSSRRFFPGYLLVKMELTDETWYLVKGTPKVTGFVGSSEKPPIVPEEEVRRITRQIEEGTLKPKPKVIFEKGQSVRVSGGPFSNFTGIVDDVNAEKGTLKLYVSIFGRSTAIELDFSQVEEA